MVREVKNNHDAPLSVAGVEIAANGGVVGIEADALRGCLGSNGIKQWLKLDLIEIEGLEELLEGDSADGGVTAPAATGIPGIPAAPLTREQLEAKATELEISFQANTKDETLVNKIAEAEEKAAGDE